MSLGVNYLNSRKVVKTTPTMKLQSVLEEACANFKLDSNCCRLKKGKTLIDLSLPYRFANLPNNTTLELEVFTQTQVGASSKLASARIALSVNGRSGMTCTFPVTHSLNDIILHCIKDGLCPDILSIATQSCPEVIYLQSRFGVESFKSTTLSGLGLSGSSARLQLRFKEGIASTGSEHKEEGSEGTSTETSQTVFSKLPSQTSEVESTQMSSARVEKGQGDTQAPMKALKNMLDSNFDVVSKPAVITLSKYLFNIFANPDVEKFRTVYTDNKAFQEKVACAQGSVDFLASAGFQVRRATGRPALVLPAFSQNSVGGHTQMDIFEASCRALEQALLELQVPSEERPCLYSPEDVQRMRETASADASTVAHGDAPKTFDPYKPFIRRVVDGSNGASIMPTGSSDRKSLTQERLEQLEKRRRELEGDLESVDRNTKLYLPGSNESDSIAGSLKADEKAGLLDMEEEEEEIKPDNKLLAQSLRGKLHNDDAPLTTAATKAVLKAQSETVYAQTAIKVRFPDKTIMVGMFHPRHTVRNIYDWVLSSLHDDVVAKWSNERYDVNKGAQSLSKGKKRGGAVMQAQADYPFELYTAPPRKVLTVQVPQQGVYNSWDDDDDQSNMQDRESLYARKLVPAAQIMLSWTAPCVENLVLDGDAQCFDPKLLQEAVSVDKSAISAMSSTFFPQGRALVESPAKLASPSPSLLSSSSATTGQGRDVTDADENKMKGKKPTWFKL